MRDERTQLLEEFRLALPAIMRTLPDNVCEALERGRVLVIDRVADTDWVPSAWRVGDLPTAMLEELPRICADRKLPVYLRTAGAEVVVGIARQRKAPRVRGIA